MKNISHFFEFLLIKIIEIKMTIFPRKLVLKAGAVIGWLLYRMKIYRNVVEKNMQYVGLWNDEEINLTIKKLYINMGRYFADFLHASSRPPEYTAENFELIGRLRERGKGLIVLLAHIGGWEMLAKIYGKKVNDLNVLAKPMKNVRVQNWLGNKRKKTGVETIYVKKSLRKSLEVLKRNGLIAILVDQHVGRQGSMVPFLGKDANTLLGVGWLLRRTGCGMLPTYALLQEDGSYKVIMEEAVLPDTSKMEQEEAIHVYQKLHNDIISEWIKKYPDHYFGWFHKRYRDNVKYSS